MWQHLRADIENEFKRLSCCIYVFGMNWIEPADIKHQIRTKAYRNSPVGQAHVRDTNRKYYQSAKGQLAQAAKNARRRKAK